MGLCDEIIICDRIANRLKRATRLYRIERTYTNSTEMFRREDVDAAIISVPTTLHKEVTSEALSHADVLVEKPMTSTLNEAEFLLRRAEQEDRILAVGHVERFNPVILELRKKLQDIGEDVYCVTSQRIGPGPSPMSTENLGAAHDLLVHDVDIAVHVIDERPTEVFASTVKSDDFPYECEIHAIYRFPNVARTVADLRASWRSGPTLKKRALCFQTLSKFITVDYVTQSLRIEGGVSEHRMVEGYYDILRAYQARDFTERRLLTGSESEPLFLEDKHFLKCVAEHKSPIVGGWDGYNALKCAIYALRSAEKGKRLTISWET